MLNTGVKIQLSSEIDKTSTFTIDDVYYPEESKEKFANHQSYNTKNVNQKIHNELISDYDQLNKLKGIDKIKDEINNIIASHRYNIAREKKGQRKIDLNLHSLFVGNPGTGKTTVARIIGDIFKVEGILKNNTFVEVSRDDLVASHIGQTEEKTSKILKEAHGGILFIDEAYSLYKEGSSKDFGIEAINTIMKYMEDNRDETMIIFAGYPDEMKRFLKSNPGLESRIANTFTFEDYSPEVISEIGLNSLHDMNFKIDENLYQIIVQQQYIKSFDNSNARWVRNFNERLIKNMIKRITNSENSITNEIIDEDIMETTGGSEVEKSKRVDSLMEELNNLVGLSNVKAFVKSLVNEVKLNKKMKQLGDYSNITKNNHMIFSGNPGTGKTTVARIIGKLFYNLDILPTTIFKEVKASDIIGEFTGHTEKMQKIS